MKVRNEMSKCLWCKKEFDPKWMDKILPLGAPDTKLCKPCLIKAKQKPQKLRDHLHKFIDKANKQANQAKKRKSKKHLKHLKKIGLLNLKNGIKKRGNDYENKTHKF